MTQITKEEFYKKYEKVKFQFYSYYKSSYGFTGETPEGNTIMYQIKEDEEFESAFVYNKDGHIVEYFQGV